MHDEDTGPQFSHFGMFVTDLEKVAGFYRDTLDFIETDRGSDRRPADHLSQS